jgi:hypothetical protein
MINTIHFEQGEGRHKVEAAVSFCGEDLSVAIGGGDTYHVGAVALATPRESLKKDGTISATASVLCALGHKDDMSARAAALRLSSAFNSNASVSVGLHIDSAGEIDVKLLQANFDTLIEQIVGRLKNNN